MNSNNTMKVIFDAVSTRSTETQTLLYLQKELSNWPAISDEKRFKEFYEMAKLIGFCRRHMHPAHDEDHSNFLTALANKTILQKGKTHINQSRFLRLVQADSYAALYAELQTIVRALENAKATFSTFSIFDFLLNRAKALRDQEMDGSRNYPFDDFKKKMIYKFFNECDDQTTA